MDSNPHGTDPLQFETATPAITSPDTENARSGVTCMACQCTIDVEVLRRQWATGLRDMPHTDCGTGDDAEGSGHPGSRRPVRFRRRAARRGPLLRGDRDCQLGDWDRRHCDRLYGRLRRPHGDRRPRRATVPSPCRAAHVLGSRTRVYPSRVQSDVRTRGRGDGVGRSRVSTQPASAEGPPDGLDLTLAVAAFLALSMALPVLMVFGSMPSGLISAAIIVFGMLQAWRMTAAPALQITGTLPNRCRASCNDVSGHARSQVGPRDPDLCSLRH